MNHTTLLSLSLSIFILLSLSLSFFFFFFYFPYVSSARSYILFIFIFFLFLFLFPFLFLLHHNLSIYNNLFSSPCSLLSLWNLNLLSTFNPFFFFSSKPRTKPHSSLSQSLFVRLEVTEQWGPSLTIYVIWKAGMLFDMWTLYLKRKLWTIHGNWVEYLSLLKNCE